MPRAKMKKPGAVWRRKRRRSQALRQNADRLGLLLQSLVQLARQRIHKGFRQRRVRRRLEGREQRKAHLAGAKGVAAGDVLEPGAAGARMARHCARHQENVGQKPVAAVAGKASVCAVAALHQRRENLRAHRAFAQQRDMEDIAGLARLLHQSYASTFQIAFHMGGENQVAPGEIPNIHIHCFSHVLVLHGRKGTGAQDADARVWRFALAHAGRGQNQDKQGQQQQGQSRGYGSLLVAKGGRRRRGGRHGRQQL